MKRTCFVMMPFSGEYSKTYAIIQQAIVNCGLDCLRQDESPEIGSIIDSIIVNIGNSSVCIADLSGLNPNVVYEMAIAHEKKKPVIPITRDDPSELPFDMAHIRTIQYQDNSDGYINLLQDLELSLKTILGEPEQILRKMLMPSSLETTSDPFVIAARPLSFLEGRRNRRELKNLKPVTSADNVGIRGLIQAFGSIYGLDRLPELLNPGDYDEIVVLEKPMNLYCIGSPKSNLWTGFLLNAFFKHFSPTIKFKPYSDSPDLRDIIVVPEIDGQEYHVPGFPCAKRFYGDFGLVIRGPHPSNSDDMLMILAGGSALGTEAACRAVTTPQCVLDLQTKLSKDFRIDLDDHHEAFFGVVTLMRKQHSERHEVDLDSLTVHSVTKLSRPSP